MICVKPLQHNPMPPAIEMEYTAAIKAYKGWWYRYIVDRRHGIFALENSSSVHRTLKGAQRAAKRWCAKQDDSVFMERCHA